MAARTRSFSLGRVEAYTDGVFAIAATLGFCAFVFSLADKNFEVRRGSFDYYVLLGSTIRNVLNVPLRVLVAASDSFAVGLVTGVQVGNALRGDVTDANVQFGVALRARVSAAVELSGQWLMPAVSPAGLDAYGIGFAVTHRVR